MSTRDQWDMICPACSHDTDLYVVFIGLGKLSADGTEDCGDHEWGDSSGCSCGCGWSGTVGDAKAAEARAVKLEDAGWYFEAEENEWRKPDDDASDGYIYANSLSEAVRQEGLANA